MTTYRHITYYLENDHGFKFKTYYEPTIIDFLRHVLEPRMKEIKGPAVEILRSAIKCKSFFEEIPEQEKADNS